MIKKKTIEVFAPASEPNVMIINGKKFIATKDTTKIIDHHIHGDKLIFEPLDEEKYKKEVAFVVDNIMEMVEKKRLLTEIVMKMGYDELKKVRKLMEKKKPMKVTDGCYGITIGEDSSGSVIDLA